MRETKWTSLHIKNEYNMYIVIGITVEKFREVEPKRDKSKQQKPNLPTDPNLSSASNEETSGVNNLAKNFKSKGALIIVIALHASVQLLWSPFSGIFILNQSVTVYRPFPLIKTIIIMTYGRCQRRRLYKFSETGYSNHLDIWKERISISDLVL